MLTPPLYLLLPFILGVANIVTQQLLSNTEICAAFTSDPLTTAPPTAPPSTTAPPTTSSGTTAPPASTPAPPYSALSSGSSSFRGSYSSGSGGDDDVYVDSPEDAGYGYYNETEIPEHSGIYVMDNSTDGSTYAPPSDANSGNYWQWTQTTYDGLYDRFDGDIGLVVQQMHYVECEAYSKAHGIEVFSDDFVQNFHLASNRPICGKKVDQIESGDVVVAYTTDEFKPDAIEFAAADVIEEIKREYVSTTTTTTEQYMDSDYYVDAQTKAQQTPVGGTSSTPASTPASTKSENDYYNTPTPAPTKTIYTGATPAPTTADYGHKICE